MSGWIVINLSKTKELCNENVMNFDFRNDLKDFIDKSQNTDLNPGV